jgi:glutamyl-tRNA reductase
LSSARTELHQIRVRFATFRDLTIDERSAHAARMRAVPAIERVLLTTCHRVELVSVDEAATAGRCVTGREAVRRVFEVVGGFDSAVVAEEQLLGQVRAAYEAALADGSTGPILNELFRRALRFGRRVRTHARPGADRSLADRGASWLLEHLGPVPAPVLVAGTGEMARLAALGLARAGHRITIASRSRERARLVRKDLAGSQHRVVIGPLERATVGGARAVVLAVRSRQPVISALHLEAGARPWTLDLSTPAAVSADAAALLGDRLLTLDHLGEIAGGTPVLVPEVERRLRVEMDDEVERFVAWLDMRRSGDALAILHGEADAVRRRHLDRLRRRAGLDLEQLAAVEAAAAAMMSELLHGPTVELRRGGADAVTVRRIFGLDA